MEFLTVLVASATIWLWVSPVSWAESLPPCQEMEKAALLEFYNYSGFDSLTNLWGSDIQNPSKCTCQWFGVECDERGFIVSLNLLDSVNVGGNFKLNASLATVPWPLPLAKLHSLKELRMYGFYHDSPLPQEIGLLSQSLTSLELSQGQLLPPLPIAALNNLSKLTYLSFSSNNLAGNIPASLGNLTKLTYLSFSSNNLAGNIPASLGNLTKLTTLHLSNNMLSGKIPHELGNLGSMIELDLSSNQLSGEIPQELGNLDDMITLDLSSNQLSGRIPVSLGRIGVNASTQGISMVNLNSNNLTGDLPWSLLTSSAITLVHIESNHLTGFAAYDSTSALGSLVNISALKELVVSGNDLTGPIPGVLLGLDFLDLSNNHLEAMSSSFANFNLSYLNLNSNDIKGPIPSWLSQLTSLHYLDLSFNQLEGSIPDWLWSLQISNIDFSMNRLRGDISLDGLCNLMGNEGSFNGSNNHFNKIQVSNASQVCSSNIMTLDLHSNHLSGLLPWHAGSNLTNKPLWITLNLADNSFSGSFPEFADISELDLSHNRLSGTIPTSVSRSGFLQSLRLSFNNFSGEIPSSLCTPVGSQGLNKFLKVLRLSILKLESNSLSGSIPDELGVCSGTLKSLVLKDNLLTGSIPRALSNLSTSLQVLDLSHNSLQGGLPPWIQYMQSLRVLILSHNGFSGPLPPTRWNTTQLQVLDLSSNKLSGTIPSQSLSDWLQGFLYNSIRKTLTDQSTTLYDESFSIEAKGLVLDFRYLLIATVSLDLSNNALAGPIPPELGLLDGLMFLDLSNNHLSGPIPESFGKLLQLNSLDLSNNELEGEILGEDLCLLTFLSSMNVSGNNLTGPIPQCNQWDTFTQKSFLGNKGLCGPQVEQQCTSPMSKGGNSTTTNQDQAVTDQDDDKYDDFLIAILVGLCIGFSTFFVLSMLWGPISSPISKVSRWILVKFVGVYNA